MQFLVTAYDGTDEGTMNRQDLDEWLAVEPYMTGKVWQDMRIQPCRVGPSFTDRQRLTMPAASTAQ